MTDQPLNRTALYENHVAAGGRIVDFAGWEMPVQYQGVIEEVRAVRNNCGVFDVSHMAQFDFAGADCAAALNDVVSNDWSKTDIGRVAYALLLNENGGVVDDVMGYHLDEDRWLVVGNASRADVDERYFLGHAENLFQHNRYSNQAMLAIQGPDSEKVLSPLCELDLSQMRHRDCSSVTLAGAKGLLARGGYTGSDGFELIFEAKDAPRVWNILLEANVVPCGLGARDVLRLEAGLPLYGHELREDWTPFESGVSFAVKMAKSAFVGKKSLEGKEDPPRRIAALQMEGKAIPREG
ncbi:MAG: glycine cleavage system aminomethyltransferase GcvT, partial [Abditibacteriaceae bacterium]